MVTFDGDNGESVGVDVGSVYISLNIEYWSIGIVPLIKLLLMVMLNDVDVVVQPLEIERLFC